MKFFNLGGGEIFLILLIAILAVGPKETAKLARQATDVIKNVRNVLGDLTSDITRAASDVADAVDTKKE